MLSIYPTAKSESDEATDEENNPEVVEVNDEQMDSMCHEIGKIKRGETLLKFDIGRTNDPSKSVTTCASGYERKNSLKLVVSNSINTQIIEELSADEDADRLPLLPHCAAEKRSKILQRLVDGVEEEESDEQETNLTISLFNTEQSMNKSLTNKSRMPKGKNKKQQTYIFRKNRDGSLTRYNSRIFVDCGEENANIDIADFTIRVERDLERDRPTSELLISKFGEIFDPKSYK